ncbi:MAG TPA: hypothetical protein VI357_04790 [Mycobacteriales bacterium]
MATSVDAVTPPRLRTVPYGAVAAAVAAVQAFVYGALAARGFFYQDDFDYTAQGADRPLTLGYLLEPNNDHLTPGLRLAYWLMAHLAPYEHWVTLVVRVVLQIAVTLLFARLLARLVGPGPVALAVLGLFAFTMLTMPSFLVLSSAVNLLPAQIAALVLLDRHVRYQVNGRLADALWGAVALLVGLLFWEKIVLAVLLPPLLSLLVLTAGSVRDRIRGTRWTGLAAYAAPVVVFFGYYLTHHYGDRGSLPSVSGLADLGWTSWRAGVAPALIGGPWRWYESPGSYFGLANPPLAGVLAGQAAVLALLVVVVRRHGARALLPWLLPAAYLLGNTVLLGVGRYQFFGGFVGRSFHYLCDTAIPVLLAVALSVALPRPVEVAARGGSAAGLAAAPVRLPAGLTGRARSVALVLVAAYVLSVSVSAARFEQRWIDNPARAYLAAVTAQLRATPGQALYDTPVNQEVVAPLGVDRRLSQVLAPLDLDVRWNDRTAGEPKVVDDSGRLRDAAFVPVAQSREGRGFCSHLLTGAGSLTVPLDRPAGTGDVFLRVDYILERGSAVIVQLGSGAQLRSPVHGQQVELHAGLNGIVVQAEGPAAVDRLVVTSANSAVRLCVTHVVAGFPFPGGP